MAYKRRPTKVRTLIISVISQCKIIKNCKDLALALEVTPNLVSIWNQGTKDPSFIQKKYLELLSISNMARADLDENFRKRAS